MKQDVLQARQSYEREKFSHRHAKPRHFFTYIDNRTNTDVGMQTIKLGNCETVDADKPEALAALYPGMFTSDNEILLDLFNRISPDIPNKIVYKTQLMK